MFGGGVGTVTYRALAGLANAGVSWNKIAMRPLPAAIEVLGAANASVHTPHGLATINWRFIDGLGPMGPSSSGSKKSFVLSATVPAGSTSTVVLPVMLGGAGNKITTVEESGVVVYSGGNYIRPLAAAGFLSFSYESSPYEALAFKLGSGSFTLTIGFKDELVVATTQ